MPGPLLFIDVPGQSAPEDLEPALASITLVIDEVIAEAAALLGDVLPVLPVPPLQPALCAFRTCLPETSNDRFIQHRNTPDKKAMGSHLASNWM